MHGADVSYLITVYLFVFVATYLKNKLDICVTRKIKALKMYNGIQVHNVHTHTYISLKNRQIVVKPHNPSH